jgi:hypothetical protein
MSIVQVMSLFRVPGITVARVANTRDFRCLGYSGVLVP